MSYLTSSWQKRCRQNLLLDFLRDMEAFELRVYVGAITVKPVCSVAQI